ncbi:hypothetical protein EDD70_2524 [Hydrogenoanaerobacterium saccharovorans]|uniref:Uncharacterized protein n=1 Tax=Hydrogenoanaerobacterium saccharovorans TaxID=474960 RepID=A0A1H8DHN5_9FIRM|nr:hypothetical protein EDD70_2524 [Hydrogenoanaerobacterium saccharovorans]SEN06047.1 hypothetical protein SAMN05216180_2585 [Hydrogenoanaerobacterium saccharovorans]
MLFLFIFFILYLLFIIFDLVPIYKKKEYKTFGIYCVMITLSFVLQACMVLSIPIPSITSIVLKIMEPILK